jgi:hypothetical protein
MENIPHSVTGVLPEKRYLLHIRTVGRCRHSFVTKSVLYIARILKHFVEAEKSTFKESCLFKGQSVQPSSQ